MPFSVGTVPFFDREKKIEVTKPFRTNDGSIIIMFEEGDDMRQALLVPRIARVKRADAYSAPDPEQEALAERVVRLLNESPA